MGFLSLEHGKAAYRADIVLYMAPVAALSALLLAAAPRGHALHHQQHVFGTSPATSASGRFQ